MNLSATLYGSGNKQMNGRSTVMAKPNLATTLSPMLHEPSRNTSPLANSHSIGHLPPPAKLQNTYRKMLLDSKFTIPTVGEFKPNATMTVLPQISS